MSSYYYKCQLHLCYYEVKLCLRPQIITRIVYI